MKIPAPKTGEVLLGQMTPGQLYCSMNVSTFSFLSHVYWCVGRINLWGKKGKTLLTQSDDFVDIILPGSGGLKTCLGLHSGHFPPSRHGGVGWWG